MKNLKYLTITAISCVSICLFYSCEKSEVQIPFSQLDEFENQNKSGEPHSYSVNCAGSCDCFIQGELVQGGGGYVQCSCEDCTMHISYEAKNGQSTETNLKDAKIQSEFISDYFDYLNKHEIADAILLTYSVAYVGEELFELFEYKLKDGTKDAIMFSKAAGGDKYEIDCNGDCGCTPIYYLDPPRASCTYEDCVMIVTEK